MDDETEIGITRYQLLRLIDPYHKNPVLPTKTNDELLKKLFELCMSKKTYRFEEYEIEKRCILEYVDMKEKDLQRRELQLKEREDKLNEKEKKLKKLPVAKEVPEVRDPIPVIRDCLIPPTNMSNAMYYSQQDEAKRYNEGLNNENKEQTDIAEAIKRSLQEEEERLLKYAPIEIAEEKKEDGPNYEKLREKTSEFTPEIVDKFYELLKQKKFVEFKSELANTPLQIASCIWKLTDQNGSTLKQLVVREGDAYKCFH